MPCTSNIIYNYDGSFEGLLCCVYESVYTHQVPSGIVPLDEAEITLLKQHYIATDFAKAARVWASVPTKMGREAEELVRCVFLSCAKEKEMMILLFLLFGYRMGTQTMHCNSHPAVAPLLAAQRALKNEVHLLLGFIRFSDYDGALVASISPKNYVLPYLQEHFCSRYGGEDFLIFDRTHSAALLWQAHRAEIFSLDHLEAPPETEDELQYRTLWQRFYQTVTIAARENPKCRMTHMPMRYWENMPEVCEERHKLAQSKRHALPAPPL